MALTQESPVAKWARQNATTHEGHYVAPTDRVVPVLFTPLIALTVAGAVGCALGPATSFAKAFGYHDQEGSVPDGGRKAGSSVNALISGHPGMA
ncbi:hypothetical protein GCM10009801_65780 [Streptomyces albiaxialis]|uniref:Uncharacterized protein n=1 Tax=Streptomyces albiaxialis TaxID=329523 RepID=A0ABN2WNV8_9ACTN